MLLSVKVANCFFFIYFWYYTGSYLVKLKYLWFIWRVRIAKWHCRLDKVQMVQYFSKCNHLLSTTKAQLMNWSMHFLFHWVWVELEWSDTQWHVNSCTLFTHLSSLCLTMNLSHPFWISLNTEKENAYLNSSDRRWAEY